MFIDFFIETEFHQNFFDISITIMFIVGKYSVYCRPFALCALLALLLIDKRTAIFMNAISCFLMFMIDAFLHITPLENHLLYSSLLIGFTTSVLAVYLVHGQSSRLKVFLRGFVISVPVIIAILCLEFSSVIKAPVIFIVYGFTSGMLSVVLMMAILPVMEKLFNVVTDYRLAELTDHKAPLIRKLIEQASGTFQHALVVSTLAEHCASAIGENPILARACAYYHDIGKLKKPEYFTENQSGYNPHDDLTPELSTDIIRSHATDGSDLIKKYGLPQILADVACQHHGKSLIKYFYFKAKKFTEEEINKENFSYKGPRPQTKIAAIIMIADCCEAISRSLHEKTPEEVADAIKNLIDERRDDGEFSECDLTLKDLDIIRKVLTNSIAGVYHDRIEYPKDDEPKKKKGKKE